MWRIRLPGQLQFIDNLWKYVSFQTFGIGFIYLMFCVKIGYGNIHLRPYSYN